MQKQRDGGGNSETGAAENDRDHGRGVVVMAVESTEILGDPYYKGTPLPRINRRSLI